MIDGKKSYDEIQIPENLSDAFERGCKRGRRTVIRRRLSKAGAALAACFCLVVLTGNETVYATLSQVPVIGTFVQMIHSGQGGQITDGAKGYAEGQDSSIQVKFGDAGDQVPHYDVQYLQMPSRIQVTLDGVRGFDRENFEILAKQTDGVRDMYFVTYLDDSAVRFVIELADGYSYNIKEYKDPGYLEISFTSGEPSKDGQAWILRSPSREMGEPLAAIQETYMNQGASITKTEEGKFTVVIGLYDSEQEAQEALDSLTQDGAKETFRVEKQVYSVRPE